MSEPAPKLMIRSFYTALMVVLAGCLLTLPACDSGPPPPLPDDAKIPSPTDLGQFEPEIKAAFINAQAKVRAQPDAANWANLARIYHAHEQLDNAIESYREAMDAGDDSNRTPHLLALALDETGNRDAAIESMTRASRQQPAYAPSFWRLGQWQLEAGNMDAADQAMQFAMEIAPEDPATLQAYGKYLIDTGRSAEAIKPLVMLANQQKGNAYARFLLGTALIQADREEEGRAQLELGRGSKPVWTDQHVLDVAAMTTGPRAEFLRLAAECDAGNAQGTLPKLLQLEPRLGDDPNYHVQIAKAYRMIKQMDNAEHWLQQALELDDQHVSASYQLAGLYRDRWHAQADKTETAHLKSALARADLVLELNQSLAAGHAVRGQILEDLGRPDESADSFLQADALDTDRSGFGYLAARVHMSHKQWSKAADILVNQCQRYPGDWALRRELGLVQWKAGENAKALQTLRSVLPKFPDDQVVTRAIQDIMNK